MAEKVNKLVNMHLGEGKDESHLWWEHVWRILIKNDFTGFDSKYVFNNIFIDNMLDNFAGDKLQTLT